MREKRSTWQRVPSTWNDRFFSSPSSTCISAILVSRLFILAWQLVGPIPLEPNWPLFLKVMPSKTRPTLQSRTGHLGSRYVKADRGSSQNKTTVKQQILPPKKNKKKTERTYHMFFICEASVSPQLPLKNFASFCFSLFGLSSKLSNSFLCNSWVLSTWTFKVERRYWDASPVGGHSNIPYKPTIHIYSANPTWSVRVCSWWLREYCIYVSWPEPPLATRDLFVYFAFSQGL